MNNLLRSLAGSQVKSSLPEAELKLLLQTVNQGRKQNHDAKISDPFYDALEDLLHDLRTVTLDNHDAEPFLKPVSKVDAPDYYDVIANPMDLQTMLKKVKQKQYKSKKEFKDDLDLIWSNCFQYNAAENHPLRPCATRLKAKAERLLKHITDRKERADPHIPSDLSITIRRPPAKLNGINGHVHPSSPPIPPRPVSNNTFKRQPSFTPPVSTTLSQRRDLPFAELPAIVRTPEGMAAFRDLEQGLDAVMLSPQTCDPSTSTLVQEKLRELAGVADHLSDGDSSPDPVDGETGDKRKLNGVSIHRPRKRVRISPTSAPTEPVELWWLAQQSNTLLANSLPPLPSLPSSSASTSPLPLPSPPAPSHRPSKRRKKPPKAAPRPNSLLGMMNSNIRTLRRVRRTNAKFAALNANIAAQNAGMDDAPAEAGGSGRIGAMDTTMMDVDEPKEEAELDERPWHLPGAGPDAGLDIGERAADQCMHWMNQKVLEHNGFQGSSKAALDVLSGISSEYLMNVGRTFRFYIDKYSNSMTPEEIILHTLFESGTTRVQELERYVKDDVVRHGNRMLDLEKKIVNAYQELTSTEAMDDDALFNEEDEEEDSAFVMGQFTEDIGEDFLGLKELGIAAELGLSSLSVPKKLLKGKKGGAKYAAAAAKPIEPPPPYPPPPPFIPLDSSNVDDQIGLLKPYYQQRLSALSTTYPPPVPGFPPPAPPPHAALPDDPPNPAQSKVGPLGQVLRTNPAAAPTKKKPKGGAGAVPATPAGSVMSPAAESELAASPKKKAPAAGTGKKRGRPPAQPQPQPQFPPVVLASA